MKTYVCQAENNVSRQRIAGNHGVVSCRTGFIAAGQDNPARRGETGGALHAMNLGRKRGRKRRQRNPDQNLIKS
jgi:hypothetical protein